LQLLPLCLELAFEPKDPYRLLELLTLPAGPFTGRLGSKLARALCRSPGIGSPAWQEVKAGLEASELEQLAWLEASGADAQLGAPKVELLSVITRVRDWLLAHIAHPKLGSTVGAAIGQCDALTQALELAAAPRLTLVEVRRLLEFVGATGAQAAVSPELAGRIAHVSSAGSLWIARDTVLWWSFTQQDATAPALAWRRQELTALAAVGVSFPDPRLRLLSQSAGWRRAVLAARQRLVLVAPRTRARDKLATHPLWDEIVARLELDASARARVTLTAGQLLTGNSALCSGLPLPELEPLTELPLPGGHAEWVAEVEPWPMVDRHSPSSLGALLGCSLQWGLRYRAGLRSEAMRLPTQHFLNGSLGHRLIEVLHQQAVFGLPEPALTARAERELDALLQSEGAVLLRPGKAAERSQVRRQLVSAVRALARTLQTAGLRILAVEQDVEVPWQGTHLDGRIDLLVGNDAGECAIVDVKWGYTGYRDLLKLGEALQLAAYTHALETQRATIGLQAAYFGLQRGALVGPENTTLIAAETVPSADLKETWRRVERTLEPALGKVAQGCFPVVGVLSSLPLLTSFGVAESAHGSHFALTPQRACKHCDFSALCGKRWEQGEL
jgi:RecB family exonuclease